MTKAQLERRVQELEAEKAQWDWHPKWEAEKQQVDAGIRLVWTAWCAAVVENTPRDIEKVFRRVASEQGWGEPMAERILRASLVYGEWLCNRRYQPSTVAHRVGQGRGWSRECVGVTAEDVDWYLRHRP